MLEIWQKEPPPSSAMAICCPFLEERPSPSLGLTIAGVGGRTSLFFRASSWPFGRKPPPPLCKLTIAGNLGERAFFFFRANYCSSFRRWELLLQDLLVYFGGEGLLQFQAHNCLRFRGKGPLFCRLTIVEVLWRKDLRRP